MRTEIVWPGEGEDGATIAIRQVAWAEGIGEYVVKTIRLPLEEAAELGTALLLAGQRARSRPRTALPARVPSGQGRSAAYTPGQVPAGRLRLVTARA
jgi:hypothetical protein